MAIQIGQSIGRYHITEQLGYGGMATVYKAYDTHLERVVAVKIIRHEAIGMEHAEKMRRRFEREAKALSKLSHPNIVHVYDYGEQEGSPYLVMEYVPSGSLKGRMSQPYHWEDAFRLVLPIVRALEYTHQFGIIHRDIKPTNILLTTQNQPMLSDFGIAKIIGSDESTQLTSTGVGIGTPEYMAPEQWQGKVTPQTDVYSLGIVLYEMVTGRRPYTADTPAAVLIKQVTEPLPRPRLYAPDLPETVEQILFKALAKNPQDRFPDMASFANALEKLLLSSAQRQSESVPSRQMTSFDNLPERSQVTSTIPPTETVQTDKNVFHRPGIQKKDTTRKKRLPIWLFILIGVGLIGGVSIFCITSLINAPNIFGLVIKPSPTERSVARQITETATPTQPVILKPTETLPVETQTNLSSLTPSPVSPTLTPTEDTQSFQPTGLWVKSSHADKGAEAFIHWNEEDPKEVPLACANCHSTSGFLDFVGGDGSTAWLVDKAVPVGEVITCEACHHDTVRALTNVKFPSGIELKDRGSESPCLECHQGRMSGVNVDEAIIQAGYPNEDTAGDKLNFINIHYGVAGAIRYGTWVKGGYEYPGKLYDAVFDHASQLSQCADCHDPHSLKIKIETCQVCHAGVKTVEDLRTVRMIGSFQDYDADGNNSEGIYDELAGLGDTLYSAIKEYGKFISYPIGYNAGMYPYFFIDGNKNGSLEENELKGDNAYKSWTPRLLRAAYNYQLYRQSPGAYAHGAKYMIELLSDSIESLNQATGSVTAFSKIERNDGGHLNGSSRTYRYWDSEGVVPANCVRCHTAGGLPVFLKDGVTSESPRSGGVSCATCHQEIPAYTRYKLDNVPFPSGASLGFENNPDANLCLVCHQGRSSAFDLSKRLEGTKIDQVNDQVAFLNIHYSAAGATLFGTEAKGLYEYSGKKYTGRFVHTKGVDSCVDCHDVHTLSVNTKGCQSCHQTGNLAAIRVSLTEDYDGDGDISEGVQGEIKTLREILFDAIQKYASQVAKRSIVYSEAVFPFYFIDLNQNGITDPNEAVLENRYTNFTPRLMMAAYNYQHSIIEPAAYAHNPKYMIQILVDSIQDLGIKVNISDRLIRP